MNIKKSIKGKVQSKVVKTERKAARKAKAVRKAMCTLAFVITLMFALTGCQQVPSRSQTLTVRDCTINVYGGGDTNGVPAVEVGTQAMSIENSGTETQTPSQTTDTKPDIDVTVGGKATGGGLLETVANKLMEGTAASESVADGTASEICTDCTDK